MSLLCLFSLDDIVGIVEEQQMEAYFSDFCDSCFLFSLPCDKFSDPRASIILVLCEREDVYFPVKTPELGPLKGQGNCESNSELHDLLYCSIRLTF